VLRNLLQQVEELKKNGRSLLAQLDGLREVTAQGPSPATQQLKREIILSYHTWYNVALPIVRANLTENSGTFKSLYTFASINADGLPSTLSAFEQEFAQQFGMLVSVPGVVESQPLALHGLVLRDVHESEIDVARGLLKSGYVREAGMIAGVALEGHIKYLCEKYGNPVAPNEPLHRLNQKLNKHYPDPSQAFQVDWMIEVRNACAHKGQQDPDPEQVEKLINTVHDFMSSVP
jgi:hypothetical protein